MVFLCLLGERLWRRSAAVLLCGPGAAPQCVGVLRRRRRTIHCAQWMKTPVSLGRDSE